MTGSVIVKLPPPLPMKFGAADCAYVPCSRNNGNIRAYHKAKESTVSASGALTPSHYQFRFREAKVVPYVSWGIELLHFR